MTFTVLLIAGLALANSPPASEATIDAFIAALPPEKPGVDPGEAFDQDRLERLIELNPDRQSEIRLVFDANERCEADAKDKASADWLRSSARPLGDEKLILLTDFYRGPDHATFARLSAMSPDDLAQADKAELDRIVGRYPLDEFAASASAAERDMWSPDGLIGDLLKCWQAYEAEMERRKLVS
jgi:hypothetical protein